MSMLGAAAGHRLMVSGAICFLVGSLQGVVVPAFTAPRLGLSAHLAAVQSGMALMIFGLLWPRIALSPRRLSIASWSINGGLWLIWLGITLAAMLGASQGLPIAGQGHQAKPLGELIVHAILVLGGLGAINGVAMIVIGLCKAQGADIE